MPRYHLKRHPHTMQAFTQIRVRYLLILLLLGISILPTAAQEEAAMPELTIQPVWEGLLRDPGWSELQVTLNNEGSDWEGELLLLDTRNEITYRQALVLPAHSNKHYRLPIFLDAQQEIKASLGNEHGDNQTYLVKFAQKSEQRICVIANSWGTIKFNDDSCHQNLYLDALSQLPETAMAWDTIDVLVINGVSTAELTPAQQESLLAWVAVGGHLVVGGGPSLAQSLAGLPEELQIATIANTKVVRNLAFDAEVAAEVAVTTLLPQTDVTTLLQDQSDLLAVRTNIGEGYVDVLSWDLNLAEGQLWLTHLWITDPIPATRIWGEEDPLSVSHAPRIHALLEVPLSKVPTLWQGMLLFPIYLLAVGGGIFIITKRLQRTNLAWALIPVWSALALLILSVSLIGRFPLVHEVATIYVPEPTFPARAVQGSAIYAPRANRLSWTHLGNPRNLAGQFISNSWYARGEPFAIESSYLERGSSIRVRNPVGVMTWGTEGLYSAPLISHDLVFTSETTRVPILSGSISSEVELHNVMLILDNGFYKIALADTILGDEKTYISNTIIETFTTSNLCDCYYYYTLSVPMPNHPCHIIAQIDQVPFPIQDIAGTHVAESCLIYAVPCPQQVTGMIEFSLIPTTPENHRIDKDNYISISKPATTVDFMQPSLLKIRDIERISIDLSSYYNREEYPFGLGELFLWDWEDETWIPVPLPAASPIVISGEAAARGFDSKRGVRLQLIPESNNSAKLTIKIKVAGTW